MKLKGFDTVQICRTPTTEEEREQQSLRMREWTEGKEVITEKEELPGDAEGKNLAFILYLCTYSFRREAFLKKYIF